MSYHTESAFGDLKIFADERIKNLSADVCALKPPLSSYEALVFDAIC